MADRTLRLDILARDHASRQLRTVAGAAEDVGDEMRDTARSAATLDGQIERVEASMRDLAREFARTGDADFKKRFRVEQSQLSGLRKLRAALGEAAEAATNITATAGTKGFNLLGGAFASLPPQAQAAAAAAAAGLAVTFSTAIGAAVTAGVLLAVGGGVLVAGIKAAANDPKVAAAFTGLRERAKVSLAGFGDPFKEPLIRAAKTFSDSIERIGPALTRMGAKMAPVIDKLAPALALMAEKALPGIEAAAEASVPLFEKLAEHLPKIGSAVSTFFAAISQGGPGATRFLDDLLNLVAGSIIALGTVFGFLATKYGQMRTAADAVAGAMITVFGGLTRHLLSLFGSMLSGAVRAFGWMPGIGPKLKTAKAEFDKFAAGVNAALDRIKDEDVYVNVRLAMDVTGNQNRSAVAAALRKQNIKAMASGGIVPATPGGQLALLAEGGQDEAVIPLPRLRGMLAAAGGGPRGMMATATAGGTHRLEITLRWPDGQVAGRLVAAGFTAAGNTAVSGLLQGLQAAGGAGPALGLDTRYERR